MTRRLVTMSLFYSCMLYLPRPSTTFSLGSYRSNNELDIWLVALGNFEELKAESKVAWTSKVIDLLLSNQSGYIRLTAPVTHFATVEAIARYLIRSFMLHIMQPTATTRTVNRTCMRVSSYSPKSKIRVKAFSRKTQQATLSTHSREGLIIHPKQPIKTREEAALGVCFDSTLVGSSPMSPLSRV